MATETFIIDVRTRGTKRSAADVKRIGTSASQVRKTLAFMRAALVAVASIRVFGSLTSSLVEFSDQMLVVKAVTQATTAQFDQLRNVAKGLGATTRFTAGEAAEGMAFLARAGFNVQEVMGAIPGVLDLAAAAQLDLGNAADIASNLMTSFGLSVSEVPDIMDTLVFTANNANTTVQQLADGLKLFAPIASQLGVDLKEASAAMAVLGDAGIQASLAGTGVRRVLTDLEAPTGALAKALDFMNIKFEEVRPSAVGLQGALQRLKDANVGASAASLLFGKRGGFVAAQLLRSLGPMGDFDKALQDIDGTSKKAAETMEEGLGGALRLVRSAIQNLIIAFADLGGEDFLNQFLRGLAEVLRSVARNADDAWAAIKTLIAVMVARKVLLFGKAMLLSAINIGIAGKNALKSAREFGVMTTAANGLRVALLKIPFIAILTSVGLLVAGFVAFRDQMTLMSEDGGTLNDVFTTTSDILKQELLDAINSTGLEFENWRDVVQTVSSRVASALEGIVAVGFGLVAAFKAIFKRIELVFLAFIFKLQGGILKVKSGFNNLVGFFGGDDVFDLEPGKEQLRGLVTEINGVTKAIEEGGSVTDAFIRGGRGFLDARKETTRLRLAAERDAAIKATEDANRAAARARADAAAAAARRDQPADGGRTDIAEALRAGGDDAAKELERLTEALQDLEAAHFPLLAQLDDEAEVRKIINDATAKGVTLRVSEAELLRRVARERIGANMTIQQAQEEQQALRNELDKTNISLEEFEFLSRKASIAFLDGQRDAASGAERAFLKLQQDATDAAKFTEMVMTDAFKAIEDAVVDFATTGTFSVNEFFRNFAEQLIRLGTQQAIAGIGSAFPSITGSGAGVQTGGGAGIGGLVAPFLAGLFHDGGAFTVGSQSSAAASLPGLDNRLVAFGARQGETVTVTPRNAPEGSGGLGAGVQNIVFNVETRDADSFNRSQSQLQNRLLAATSQARRRR
jgi:TP901 family phage tail tape measure protein/lambda family phage tail tape measure protein